MGQGAPRWSLVVAALLLAATARAQDLGHRVPGALGLYAGSQQPLGLYFANRLQIAYSNRLFDRNGNQISRPGFNQRIIFDTAGVIYTLNVHPLRAHLTTAFAVFGGKLASDSVNPTISIDHSGVGDLWLQPLELGWRLPYLDLVLAYAFYIPTGSFQFNSPTGGLGTGHWAQEFSLGFALYLDHDRSSSISYLATYALNQRDRGVDVTAGDVVNVEGGIGKRFFDALDVGVTTFAHWQVRADQGADVPARLRGVENRRFAVGPEVSLAIPELRTFLTLRYVHDFGVVARPEEQTLIVQLTFTAWQPRSKPGQPKPAARKPAFFAP
jgi:hypothetical protein